MDGIRAGIELVLENDGYRAAAKRVADEMRALPAVDELLDPYADDRASLKSG